MFPVVASLAIVIAVVVFFVALPYLEVRWAALAAVLVLFGFVLLVTRTPMEAMWWLQGAVGERRVAHRLESLEADGFVVLYDRRIPGRGGNIDAVAVGPPGVFAIETKVRSKRVEVWPSRITVGGMERNELIEQAIDRAQRVQFALAEEMSARRLTVVPILCLSGSKPSGGDRANGVLVVSDREIASRLRQGPPVLSANEVVALARKLDLSLPPYAG